MVSQSVSQTVSQNTRLESLSWQANVCCLHLSFCRYKRYFEVCNKPYFLIASLIYFLLRICISVNYDFLGERSSFINLFVLHSLTHTLNELDLYGIVKTIRFLYVYMFLTIFFCLFSVRPSVSFLFVNYLATMDDFSLVLLQCFIFDIL